MYYYRTPQSRQAKGCFSLQGYRVELGAEIRRPNGFKLVNVTERNGRVWYFSCANAAEMHTWVEVLKQQIGAVSSSRRYIDSVDSGAESASEDEQTYDEPYDDSIGEMPVAQPGSTPTMTAAELSAAGMTLEEPRGLVGGAPDYQQQAASQAEMDSVSVRASALRGVLPGRSCVLQPTLASRHRVPCRCASVAVCCGVVAYKGDPLPSVLPLCTPRRTPQHLVPNDRPIQDMPWFFPGSDRSQAEALLAGTGRFLVRERDGTMVLSVNVTVATKHYKIFFVPGSGLSVGGDKTLFFQDPVRPHLGCSTHTHKHTIARARTNTLPRTVTHAQTRPLSVTRALSVTFAPAVTRAPSITPTVQCRAAHPATCPSCFTDWPCATLPVALASTKRAGPHGAIFSVAAPGSLGSRWPEVPAVCSGSPRFCSVAAGCCGVFLRSDGSKGRPAAGLVVV